MFAIAQNLLKVKDGLVASNGEYKTLGFPGSGSKIRVERLRTGSYLQARLKILSLYRERVSIQFLYVNAGNPVVFLSAEELALKGKELPTEVENMPETLNVIESIRSIAAEMIWIVSDRRLVTSASAAYPKIEFVSLSQKIHQPRREENFGR